MKQKAQVAPEKIRIGKLAKDVGVEKFVIRFWEKEFGFRPHRTEGGQRYYTQKDVERFQTIKMLLYKEKYTIDGAKTALRERKQKTATIIPARKDIDSITNQLKTLKEQLIKLRKTL